MIPRMSPVDDGGGGAARAPASVDGGSASVDTCEGSASRDFVRTPFSVRRNVVKLWRPLPARIWFELGSSSDRDLSIPRERAAAVGVAILILVLTVGLGSVGFRTGESGGGRCFPLIGKSIADAPSAAPAEPGWYYAPGQSLVLVLWVVIPPLLGWAIVRGLWIPLVVRRHASSSAAITFARHLLSVYMFVYVMIVGVTAALMPALILVSPVGTEFFRWCLWCFLFGESFFVPAVMWGRFIIADRDGSVFGRYRNVGLALYLLLFVVIPILGMVQQLD